MEYRKYRIVYLPVAVLEYGARPTLKWMPTKYEFDTEDEARVQKYELQKNDNDNVYSIQEIVG